MSCKYSAMRGKEWKYYIFNYDGRKLNWMQGRTPWMGINRKGVPGRKLCHPSIPVRVGHLVRERAGTCLDAWYGWLNSALHCHLGNRSWNQFCILISLSLHLAAKPWMYGMNSKLIRVSWLWFNTFMFPRIWFPPRVDGGWGFSPGVTAPWNHTYFSLYSTHTCPVTPYLLSPEDSLDLIFFSFLLSKLFTFIAENLRKK